MTTRPVIFFDNAEVHDARAGAGDFDNVREKLRQSGNDSVVGIEPTLDNFSRLNRIASFACSLKGVPAPDLPLYDPAKSKKIHPDFVKYVNDISQPLKTAGVEIVKPEQALTKVLTDFDEKSTSDTRANLLRLLGVLSDDVYIGPHTFHLDISNRCNTNCIFCGLHSPMLLEPKKKIRGRRFTEGWKGRTVDMDIFTALVDDLALIECKEDVLFSGEGEPLTHPRASEMIRYVKGKDLALTLFTNGLSVTETMADMFVETGLDILYWSLSAGTAKTFAELQPARKESDFTRMIDVMSYLVKQKRKSENKPYIILAHVINNLNYAECEKIMDIAKSVGIDSLRYQIMHSCSSTEPLLISKEHFDIAQKQIDKARLVAEKAGIEIVANIDFQLSAAAKTYELPETVLPCHWSHDLYNKTGCLAGWFFSRSFTDGRISFCCHDKIVGNLYRARYKDLWFSDRYRRIRSRAKAFDMSQNMDLTDECCGGMLLDEDCNYCGNYEFINQALKDLSELGWDKFLRRAAG